MHKRSTELILQDPNSDDCKVSNYSLNAVHKEIETRLSCIDNMFMIKAFHIPWKF
jgi:hypothetical protein